MQKSKQLQRFLKEEKQISVPHGLSCFKLPFNKKCNVLPEKQNWIIKKLAVGIWIFMELAF